jgi:hypothetical protein
MTTCDHFGAFGDVKGTSLMKTSLLVKACGGTRMRGGATKRLIFYHASDVRFEALLDFIS